MIPSNGKLKQPTKFTHISLEKCEKEPNEQSNHNPNSNINPNNLNNLSKTKPIQKLPNRKKITKTNEPSALRLAAINDTFHKIEQNTTNMIDNFNIDKQLLEKLVQYQEKIKCVCGRNIKYYCLKCWTINKNLNIPQVIAPFQIGVLHHELEKINKSSIAPMKLVSGQVQFETYETKQIGKMYFSDWKPSETCILFPHKDSKKLTESPIEDIKSIKNVIILDCTWFQTDQLIDCLEKQGFNRYIRLEDYNSLFWRYNHHSDKALSSAQALAYFFREYQQTKKQNVKQFDNLMFLYLLNLRIVQKSYRNEQTEKKECKDIL